MKLCGPGSVNCRFKFSLNQLQQQHFFQKSAAGVTGLSVNAAKEEKKCLNDDALECPQCAHDLFMYGNHTKNSSEISRSVECEVLQQGQYQRLGKHLLLHATRQLGSGNERLAGPYFRPAAGGNLRIRHLLQWLI